MYLQSSFIRRKGNKNLRYSKKNVSQDTVGPKRRYYLWTLILVLGIHQVIFKRPDPVPLLRTLGRPAEVYLPHCASCEELLLLEIPHRSFIVSHELCGQIRSQTQSGLWRCIKLFSS